MLLNSGPFTLAPGDTQEVYVGFVVGLGADRLSSISVMKFNDQFVQNTFDALFQVPKPPPNPRVVVAELDQKVVLDWGSDATILNNVENKPAEPGHYVFEGYNVYQLPASNSTLRDAKRIATYDLASDPAVVVDLQPVSGVIVAVPVQFGTNSGITRYFEFIEDRVKDIKQIYNGQEYYIAVTAYSIATVKGYLPQQLECTPIILTVIPHKPAMGTRTQAAFADTILPAHTAGSASGSFSVKIINPTAITGHVYQVQAVQGPAKKIILSTGDTLNAFNNQYKLVDLTKGTVVIASNQNFGIDPSNIIVPDGFQFGFQAVPYYVEGQEIADFSLPSGWTLINQASPYVGGTFLGSSLKPFQVTKSIEIDFLGTPKSGAVGQKAYDFVRTATSGSGGAPYAGFFAQPFTVWDITGGTRRQIDFAFMEVNSSKFYDSVWTPGTASGDREYWFIIDQDYTPTAKALYTATATVNSLAGLPVLYSGWPTSSTQPSFKAGDKLIIHASVALGADDKWTFTTDGRQVVASSDVKKSDINRITVFPNPYYCINSAETSRFVKYVQFTNMPTVATIRIFNLAGQLVRVLHKNDTSTFFKWDLANEVAYPVASGMYLAYIDIPDVGSKVLKIAIIQEQELLDVY